MRKKCIAIWLVPTVIDFGSLEISYCIGGFLGVEKKQHLL